MIIFQISVEPRPDGLLGVISTNSGVDNEVSAFVPSPSTTVKSTELPMRPPVCCFFF